MSRLCVKNLPKYVVEERLRDFFSQRGEVTDAKLMRTKDGKSRRFAFIGFRTEHEAEEAIKFFNNTYMDTCRITCEVAYRVGDPSIPRPWSRYSARDVHLSGKNMGLEAVGVSSFESKEPETVDMAVKDPNTCSIKSDPQFQEFLQIMQPRAKAKLWANDTLAPANSADKDGQKEGHQACLKVGFKMKLPENVLGESNRSSDDEEEDQVSTLRSLHDGASETLHDKDSHDLGQDVGVSDMDYFKSRVKKNWSDSEGDEEENLEGEKSLELVPNEDEISLGGQLPSTGGSLGDELPSRDAFGATDESEGAQSRETEHIEQPANTGRLFIRNLPYTTRKPSDDELLELFSGYGEISQVHIVVEKDTRRSKGIGYVQYTQPEFAIRALKNLDNSIFQGRLLHIMLAKVQKPTVDKQESIIPPGHAVVGFKQKREEHRKASEAGGDTRAWNSLFIRQDTVVENIARKFGLDKSEVLDKQADDLAVRVALAETHTIAETKKALRNAGINVVALEGLAMKKGNIHRSNHVILVKNLPYGSSEGDLVKMFGKFGSLDKVILPPTKTLALIIFLEAAEAHAAFKCLAYKRYIDAPLYLEWAPGDILAPKPALETDKQEDIVGREDVQRMVLEESLVPIPEGEIDPDRVESRSVFVKNLNFKTSDDGLREHFVNNMKKGKLLSVKVKKHQKNGKNVSAGYGFIEFISVETARDACRDLQGTVLDGHALILQLCHPKEEDQFARKVEKDKSSTKLIIRNVAFEATEKDLRQLFSSFGQVRRVRLPKRVDNHRGFAFVEYATKQETENAMKALSNTHLYGRHLVIERAKEGETLEELRARTAAHFSGQTAESGKKSNKRKRKNKTDDANEDDFEGVLD